MTHSSTHLVQTVTRRSNQTGDAVRALKQTFRENPSISSEVRAQTAIWALGIRVFQRRLRHLLGELNGAECDLSAPPNDVAGAIWHYETNVLGTSAVSTRTKMGLTAEASAPWERQAIDCEWPVDDVERLAVLHSLPDWLAAHFYRLLGTDAARLMAILNRAGPIAFRAPSSTSGRRALAAELFREGIVTRPGRVSRHALLAAGRPNIRASSAYRAGRFEVQDEASQLVIAACGGGKPRSVWDVCAGRGGKTIGLALAGHKVFATDVDDKVLDDLRVRLRRVESANVRVARLPPPPTDATADQFDVVLIDAPCSSLGTLRRSPDRRWTIRPGDIGRFAELQREILWRACCAVKPGGVVVYATCTLAAEENQDVVDAFLKAHPDFSPAPLSLAWGMAQSRRLGLSSDAHQVTLLPHVHGTDGFFIARLSRRTEPQAIG